MEQDPEAERKEERFPKIDIPYDKLLYENRDGFQLVWRRGSVGLLNKFLRIAVEEYGLGEAPDLQELQKIMTTVLEWMENRPYSWDIGPPCYDNETFFGMIKGAIKPLAGPSEDASEELLQVVLEKLTEARAWYDSASLSR